jgi:hypothetical protein
MATLEDRESAFENKFAHDQDLRFRVEARRTKLLGHWAAGVMGVSGDAAEAYAKSLVAADMAEAGSDDVRRKLVADLAAKGMTPEAVQLDKKMAELLEVAKMQIMAG